MMLAAAAAVLAATVVPGSAQAALPEAVKALIENAARDARRMAESDAAVSRALDHATFAESQERTRHRRGESSMSAVVIGAIAEHPELAAEIVAAAMSAAPGLGEAVARNASEAFPGFAPAIAAATGGAVPAVPSAKTAAAAAPTAPEVAARPAAPDEIYDPIEGFNRAVFAFNDTVDGFVLAPIATLYGFLTPPPVRQSVRNFFSNLRSPVILANDLLQAEGGDALVTTGRFVVNTTVGLLGLFDVATDWGLPYHPADFGQTLHSYGSGPGPYLVLPLLGPSTARDGVGIGVDVFLDPLTYLLDLEGRMAVLGTKAVVRREELLQPLAELRAGALDYYAALRSAYYQDRAVELRKGQPADTSRIDTLFESME